MGKQIACVNLEKGLFIIGEGSVKIWKPRPSTCISVQKLQSKTAKIKQGYVFGGVYFLSCLYISSMFIYNFYILMEGNFFFFNILEYK